MENRKVMAEYEFTAAKIALEELLKFGRYTDEELAEARERFLLAYRQAAV